MIERRKIFCGASPARDDDDLDLASAVEVLKPGRDLDGSRFSLYLCRVDQHAGRMMAASEYVQDVPHRRSLRRSDDPDPERQRRDRPLSRSVEQPLGVEPTFQLLKRQL